MKRENRLYTMYLDDILESMNRIAEYISGYDFVQFKRDYKTVDAVIRNFEIIVEAAKKIPLTIKEKYSDIPWDEMYLLRNKVTHEYFGVDYEIIWDVAINYLPKNKTSLEEIISIEKRKSSK